MESSYGPSCNTKHQNHNSDRKRQNRAPSPARPLLKDIHSRSPGRPPGIVPQSPKLSTKQHTSAGLLATQSRVSRRTGSGEKEKITLTKCHTKAAVIKKAIKIVQHGSSEQKVTGKQVDTTQNVIKGRKGRNPPAALSDKSSLVYSSPICVPTGVCLGIVSHSDSSSDLSDCPSDPLTDEQRLVQSRNSDAQHDTVPGFCDRSRSKEDNARHAPSPEPSVEPRSLPLTVEPCAMSSADAKGTRAQGHCSRGGPTEKSAPVPMPGNANGPAQRTIKGNRVLFTEDLLREIEELRSENDYLKDEVEELRAEMEEARDTYLEEEMQQLQEVKHELDCANRSCRVLQYRLHKAEQRSLQLAHSGQAGDGELLRTLEQDLKVAKDVSLRLHNELESVEERCSKAEDENEVLRQKIVEVEITKQALQNNLERLKESSLKRRGGRDLHKEKKSVVQEDSTELRCQLQFVREELSLMRRKTVKLGREKDELEEELQKYKSAYGDLECAPPAREHGGPPTTQEAELKLRLKLVEEEATILGRKVVDLEVENRGLRAENEDARCQYERSCLKGEPLALAPPSPCAGAPEKVADVRRQLRLVEEEAEVLRHSVCETEGHNRWLSSELRRLASGRAQEGAGTVLDGPALPGGGSGGVPFAGSAGGLQEELRDACQKIDELSRAAGRLQQENHVLMSSVQTGDPDSQPADGEAEGRYARRDSPDEEAAASSPQLRPRREGPVGGESDSEDSPEESPAWGCGKPASIGGFGLAGQALEMFLSLRREAERLGKAVDHLITDTDCLIYDGELLVTARGPVDGEPGRGRDTAEGESEPQGLDAVSTRMKAFKAELYSFIEKVDRLGESSKESPGPSNPLAGIAFMSHDSPHLPILGTDPITKIQAEDRRSTQSQEELQEELRFLRHSTSLFYARLWRLLQRWRHGCRNSEADGRSLSEELDNVPELDVVMGQVEGRMEPRICDPSDSLCASQPFQTIEHHQNQPGNNHQILRALQALLQEFLMEIQDGEEQCWQVQHKCTNEKTAWEMQWADLNHIKQPESGREMALGGGPEPLNQVQKVTRHSIAPDPHRTLQFDNSGRSREKTQPWNRVYHEKCSWDSRMRAPQNKTDQLQRSLNMSLAEKHQLEQEAEHCGTISAQDSPTDAGPHHTCSVTEGHPRVWAASRTHQPTKSLFLDALLLDTPMECTVPSSRRDSKKNVRCLNEALNETNSRKGQSGVHEEDMGGGGLLRVKSVCSMSDFQRLIDSSPFLSENDSHLEQGDNELTPPLSPDDLKYIEEFNNKSWAFPGSRNASVTTEVAMEASGAESLDRGGTEETSEPFPPASWSGKNSVTITTDTLYSLGHCQDGAFQTGILNSGDPLIDSAFTPSAIKAESPERKGSAKGVYEQCSCGPQKHQGDRTEAQLCPIHVGPAIGFTSPLRDPGMTRNLSDGMKEVAFSARSAPQGGATEQRLRHAACQTSSVATRGTQTTRTASVGLQTESLRGLASSPHQCLTPKAGSTPVCSPSRCTRRMLLSPVVQSKFERSCCSPKCGSPMLQRKAFAKTDQAGSRATAATAPQKGFSESAWARSTTTRDSPVHATINDGLSSLFNIIDHSPVFHEAPLRFPKSPSLSRLGDPNQTDASSTKASSVQRQAQEGLPSPLQLLAETKDRKSPEAVSIRQDLQNPPSCSPADGTSRSPRKKLQVTPSKEETVAAGGNPGNQRKEGKVKDNGQPGASETYTVLLTPPWRL